MSVIHKELFDFYTTKCNINNNILSTKILYTKNSKGVTRIWSGHVIITSDTSDELPAITRYPIDFYNSTDIAVYYTSYQQINGKLTLSKLTQILTGLNIGRSNETTCFQQALYDIMKLFNKKVSSGAKYTIEETEKIRSFKDLPNKRIKIMLLQNAQKFWKKVKFPCYVQPKLDGVHIAAVYTGEEIILYTRSLKKKITQYHISTALEPLKKFPGVYLFGELWTKDVERQDINGIACQENDSNITQRLNFNIFDSYVYDKDQRFSDRFNFVRQIVKLCNSKYITEVTPKLVKTNEELVEYYNLQLEKEYEGIVIRNTDSVYESGVRSYGTMKYKPREDSEFLIVGFKDGVGKNKGLIIFRAKVPKELDPNEREFDVVPKWTENQRREAYLIGESYINKMATISYDIISNDGVPIQPILLVINF